MLMYIYRKTNIEAEKFQKETCKKAYHLVVNYHRSHKNTRQAYAVWLCCECESRSKQNVSDFVCVYRFASCPVLCLALVLCVMFTVDHDAILFPDEFILKYQRHSLVSLAVHSCPNFQAPIICFSMNLSLSLSPTPSLSHCLTHIYFFLTFFFFFTCPILWLAGHYLTSHF